MYGLGRRDDRNVSIRGGPRPVRADRPEYKRREARKPPNVQTTKRSDYEAAPSRRLQNPPFSKVEYFPPEGGKYSTFLEENSIP
jgi:hypothetical protein